MLSILLLLQPIYSQTCSQLNPCQQGCCSIYGFCGTGPDYCYKGVVQYHLEGKCGVINDVIYGCRDDYCCTIYGNCRNEPEYCVQDAIFATTVTKKGGDAVTLTSLEASTTVATYSVTTETEVPEITSTTTSQPTRTEIEHEHEQPLYNATTHTISLDTHLDSTSVSADSSAHFYITCVLVLIYHFFN